MQATNIIMFSVLISSGIFACNITKSNVTNVVNNLPSNSSSPYNYNNGKIIKVFIDNKVQTNEYESLFAGGYDLSRTNLSVNSSQLYYSDGNNVSVFNLSNLQLEIKGSDCNKENNNLFDKINVFKSLFPINEFCKYPGFRIKQGKNNDTYLFNYSNLYKINDKNISESYNGPLINHFQAPIAVDKNSNIYTIFDNQIKKINSNHKEEWIRNKNNTSGEDFENPADLEVDDKGNVYFLSSGMAIKKMTPDGFVSTIIGNGDKSELSISGKEYKILQSEIKMAMDKFYNLYIIEKINNRILKYDIKSDRLSLFAGGGKNLFDDNIQSTQSGLYNPSAITFDNDNNAYILDLGNKAIRKVDAKTNIISTIIGNSLSRGDGTDLSKVSLKNIISIYSKNNNLYISEEDRIRKVNEQNVITTIVGNGFVLPSASPIYDQNISLDAEKTPITKAKILFIDKENTIYINEGSEIKKITSDNKLSALAQSIAGDSITQDSKGNIYIASGTIKKFSKNGDFSVFAGRDFNYRESLNKNLYDGVKATEVMQLDPRSIVIDSKNNIYAITQASSNISLVRPVRNPLLIIRISYDGIIKIISTNNENTSPLKIVIDKEDNIYCLEVSNFTQNNIRYNTIKKIDKSGNISIYVGNVPSSGYEPELNNTKTSEAIFNRISITDITVDDKGIVYFSTNENKIYKIE